MSLPKRKTTNAGRVRSGLNAPEQREWPKHQKFVRGFNCVVCDTYTLVPPDLRIEFAHVRVGTDGGTSLKPHDAFGLPMCSDHHAEQHRLGEYGFTDRYRRAFPKGMKAKALEFALASPVAEVRERARACVS